MFYLEDFSLIALVFCGDIRVCPYIDRYLERLDKLDSPYQVLFWNRAALELDLPSNYLYYNSPSDEGLNKVQKLIDFYGFQRWLKHEFSAKKYDKVIALSTLSGILISSILKEMKGRYIFDIRDYSYENIGLFYRIEERIIKNSYFTAISSPGYRSFLPDYPYIIAHNFNRREIPSNAVFKRKNQPINLVWNGTVRYFDFQRQYLDLLKNDDRFYLTYHGIGVDLKKYQYYCEDNHIENVQFTGPYDNKDKSNLLKDASILNNAYGIKKQKKVKYAISNRFYDGIIFHIPQMVETNTFKATLTESQGVGISISAEQNFSDMLYEYYINIEESSFNQKCDNALSQILKEDDLYIEMIDNFIRM